MNIHFTKKGWIDYQHWIETDLAIMAKINDLIEDARRHPFTGLGKPEPLRDDLKGWWSRRITGEHRLIYKVEGKRGLDQHITIANCRYHYER